METSKQIWDRTIHFHKQKAEAHGLGFLLQTDEKPRVESEGRNPPTVFRNQRHVLRPKSDYIGFGLRRCGAFQAVLTPWFVSLTLPVVSEPLRSKGFLSPFAARRAVGE